jgi:hypothetical protein
LGVIDDLAKARQAARKCSRCDKQRRVEIHGSAARIHAASRAAVTAQAA